MTRQALLDLLVKMKEGGWDMSKPVLGFNGEADEWEELELGEAVKSDDEFWLYFPV